MEIPQERTIGYDSGRYTMGGIDHRPGNTMQPTMPLSMENPRAFKSVGKISNTEGWLQVQSHKNNSEWRVDIFDWQRKYVMLYDKLLFVFDEDKLHMRIPTLMLNFDQQYFVLDTPAKQSSEFRYTASDVKGYKTSRSTAASGFGPIRPRRKNFG